MAPIPTPFDLSAYLAKLSLSEREAITNPLSNSVEKRSNLSPIEAFNVLVARSPATTANPAYNPGAGSVPPDAFNNKGVQAVFALIGTSFVLGAIWFFFWAKNGGFKWRKGDWDEYKSTVLRRKGPNGTTLSNATKSTVLGGGSVVGEGFSDSGGTRTELSSDMSDIMSEKQRSKKSRSDKRSARKEAKESAKEKKLREVREAEWEGGHDEDVRAYRHERVAKVGGLNRDSDALFYGTDYSETAPSVTHQQQQSSSGESVHRQPQQSSSRIHSRHASPDKRDRQPTTRRDFSYGQDSSFSATQSEVSSTPMPTPTPAPVARPPRYHSPTKAGSRLSRQSGSLGYTEPLDFDAQSQNTKTYHHPLPELSRAKVGGGGYRRDRRDNLDD